MFTLTARAADRQIIHYRVPAAATNAAALRHSSPWTKLNLTLGLPLRNREGLTNLLQQLYDPASPNFRHFLTPEQFTEKFGPTEEDYESVVNFAKSHGLVIKARHSNRMVVSVKGTVQDIERVFHVTVNEYQHPTESRTFYAANVEPSLDLATPVLSVGGLDNYVVPRPCLKLSPPGPRAHPLLGSGPDGSYLGTDFRAAYAPGVTLTGTGQIVGILEFDAGFYQSDITAYEAAAGVPGVPVVPVLLDGYNGGPGSVDGNAEASLDVEMAVSVAPGLREVLVYEGSATDDILSRIATDNLAKQIGVSWTYPIDATSDQLFQQLAAQGQSYFNASGDGDAYTDGVASPTDDPNITVVGGTTLSTVSAGGAWSGETVWNSSSSSDPLGSSGGISTSVPIPSWQQGINMTQNQGSTTFRNLPDVALTGDNIFVDYDDGQSGASFVGTSCAVQIWAAYTALVNQLAVENGEPTVGFINPAIYAMGKGSNAVSYTSLFHDVTTGNNEWTGSPNEFSAVPGYDLCTGWGTPTGMEFIKALALPEPLQISPLSLAVFNGPVGGPFGPGSQTFSIVNSGVGPLNWSLVSTSSWLTVSPTNGTLLQGGAATSITVGIDPSAASLPAGSFSSSLVFSNLGDGVSQTRQVTLAVVTPPVIIAQPSNASTLVATTTNFSVGIAPNALMYYQWRLNGLNLSDRGSFSGATTSILTVSNVTGSDAGSYSVVLSNAAGVLTSSNALLTVVQSEPIIVQQPTNQSALPGATASFSVTAVGNTPYNYKWIFNGATLANNSTYSGASSQTLTVSNVSAAVAGTYTVVVGNFLGTTTSTGAVLSVIPISVPGLDISVLYSFDGVNIGGDPYSPLVQANDGNLYGTALEGGDDSIGTIFRVTTKGVPLNLLSFSGANGEFPYAGLALGKDGSLYGAASGGGANNDGMLFKITTSGTPSTLSSFDQNNGELPVAGLVQGSDGNFYGTALEGGFDNQGTIFRMTTTGVVTPLVSFNLENGGGSSGVLIQGRDGNFYGTTEIGGAYDGGTVFRMSPSGDFTNLYSFTGGDDGESPIPGLVQATDGNFYGTTYELGAYGFGTVFQMTPSGTLTTLYAFMGTNDGGYPWGGLVQASDGNLYGVTSEEGQYGFGTVFRFAPNGPLTTVAQFDGYTGANPLAALIQAKDGNLYGTTAFGGADNAGTVYKLTISGPLQITGQPANQSAFFGGTTFFSVATFGAGPVSYQWQKFGSIVTNGNGISGANTATLSISNISFSDAALYSVVVSNAYNALTSAPAVLAVEYAPPGISTQPVSQTVVAGTTVSFNVVAFGNNPLSYQWQMNGTNLTDGGNIVGSGTPALTISDVTLADQGTYSVLISNVVFELTSENAVLTVVPATSPGTSVTSLHLFSDSAADGAFPYSSLIQGKDGSLYGTAQDGGADFSGVIFKMTLSGALTPLFSLPNSTATGFDPTGALVQLANGSFYGTTAAGGDSYGTAFRLTLSPRANKDLYLFGDGDDGAEPVAGLIEGSDGNLYGTALQGGEDSLGTVFQLTTGGVLTPLYSFTGGDDGGFPYGGVIQGKDGNFYGTTLEYGSGGYGTVFSVDTQGDFNTLASFGGTNGAYLYDGVIQGVDGSFYGTAYEGGSNGFGTVFNVTTNGAFTTLYSFSGPDGAYPAASLLQGSDGNLYGTTSAGGAGGQGTVFRITTNGALTTLLWFDGLNGAAPQAPLIQANNGSFYGTTLEGGTDYNPSAGGGNGLVFRLTVPIFLTNSITLPAAIAALPYYSSISNFATAPSGDTLSFAKVSGPLWLSVATNGLLSGTPGDADIGTNVFAVSLTDTNGVSATNSLIIAVIADPPPTFILNPFAEPWANVYQEYSATIATNVTDAEIGHGDILSFAFLSGPSWLRVASNGTLSGTPIAADLGTNSFLVSVSNLGGSSSTANLTIYVTSGPEFVEQNFSTPAAVIGLPYSVNVATNVIDSGLGAGDELTFSKVSGPAWLNVAGNGALSGTPSATNAGLNTFLIEVIDPGGLSATANLQIAVNAAVPPSFVSNPFSEPVAVVGLPYAANLTNSVIDPNYGDLLSFSKVSGPAWLNIASDGTLTGTPFATNEGLNVFIVNVGDLEGLTNNATMDINVTGPHVVAKLLPQGNSLVLSWVGGSGPYQIEVTSDLTSPVWQTVSIPTNATNFIIVPTNGAAFYQVLGQ
jgi:uncharacterized repeat protein (TIGR03803 family)